ncbi:MAG: zinc-binding alcohol dehydrogenase family protein [Rhizobiales bacterium]|nr:zinc-binding alcohol dehydrogenase family protein [Hyphomicrobiales bacterium]NRB14335.1 zinc-binding alcohol dehydrogenase family protein [Hyphomicrobiales bacterium]
MKALVIDKKNHTKFCDIDTPKIADDEILIDVDYVGICGSDLNTFRGLNPLVTLPRIPGHEIGGVIAKKGTNVPNEFNLGDRAIVIPYSTCGKCSSCLSGRVNACKFNQTLGVQKDGGMCSQIAVHYDRLILNKSLRSTHLALVEPLSVGFHAVARGRVSSSDTVVILGGGMIGVGAILASLAAGARVIVSEVSTVKHKLLKEIGVETVINPQTSDLENEIKLLTDGHGANVVIEAVGLPETFVQAVDLTCFTGRVVYVGYAKDNVSYNTSLFNLKELDIMGSRNATRVDFEAVIEFLEHNSDLANNLISKIFSWADADQAFDYWEKNRNETFKIMVDMKG